MLTIRDLEQALPAHLKSSASQSLLDMINNASTDPQAAEMIRENFMSYTGVLKEGRFKTEDYLHAVKYVSFKVMGFTNQEAYARTFPQRYQSLITRGASEKDISAYVAAYNKGRLINLVLEQTLIPSWVLNQDTYQKAVNKLAMLMATARSEKVQCDAATSLLTHLKRPEKKEIELNLGIAETSGMRELKGMLTDLADKQRSLIEGGVRTREIAHQKLVHGEEIPEAELVENKDQEDD